MIEPVVFSIPILTQARAWGEACLASWSAEGLFPRIGDSTFISPVNGEPRKVVLHLSAGFRVKGKAFIGIRSESGEVIGDGYTVVLNRDLIAPRNDLVLPVLLHELTHAVDPLFDEDVRAMGPLEAQGVRLEATDLYDLPSEQRAFTAMWTEDLRQAIARGEYRNPSVSLLSFRNRSPEFDGFYAYGQLRRHDLIEQSAEHVRQIVRHLIAQSGE